MQAVAELVDEDGDGIWTYEELVLGIDQLDPAVAARLVALATRIRRIREQGLTEGASTRLLIYAALLMRGGIDPIQACRSAICQPLTDDERLQETMEELIRDFF